VKPHFCIASSARIVRSGRSGLMNPASASVFTVWIPCPSAVVAFSTSPGASSAIAPSPSIICFSRRSDSFKLPCTAGAAT